MRRDTIAIVVGLAVVLLVAGAAVAGKPSSSLSLVVLSSDGLAATSSAEPSYGNQVTFEVQTTQTDRPFVNVRCYQGGAWVYDGWNGFFDGYPESPAYTLSAPGYWEGGAADCTARLLEWSRNRWRTLATMEFHVTG